jgi:EpsI family protein
MNKDNERIVGRRATVVAAVMGVVLMLSSGVGYRLLAQYLSRPTTEKPLPPGTLSRLPLQIGEWHGKDVPLDQAIVKRTRTDDHVSRQYLRDGGRDTVWLFVAYGVRARDLEPHHPEVCYPSAGWTLVDTQDETLKLSAGKDVECRIFRFTKGGLTSQTMTVLSYYIVDGETCPDVSLLRSKAWSGSAGIRYMAQVQVAYSDNGQGQSHSAVESVRTLAADSAPEIQSLLTNATAGVAASGK